MLASAICYGVAGFFSNCSGPFRLQNSHFKVESTMNVFDGSFVKRMYTPYGGTHTNLAAECKVLPK